MNEVIFKDYIELSPIFPDLTHVSDAAQFKADNESLTFTIKDEFVDVPWDISVNDIVMVVGVNQQSLKRYIETYVEGGTTNYGSTWEEGYYRVYVRKYKRPTNGEDYVNLLDSNDFFELTKKDLYWNKSILSFMVYIQPGKFWMGSPVNELGRNPDELQHQVTLTEGFYVGRTILTNGMFNAVMNGVKPASDLTSITVGTQSYSTCFSLSNTYWAWYKETDKNDEFGKVYISYNKYEQDKSTRDGEIQGFKKTTLNGQNTYYPYPYLFNNNLPSGETDNSFITVINSKLPIAGSSTNDYTGSYTWDLPTEAQWEYVCRSGKKSAFNNGENLHDKNFDETETSYATEPQINEICWYKMHDGQRHECAMLKPSQWGLYDCHGNNWEWTKDFLQYYSKTPVVDPYNSDPTNISTEVPQKVIRGGWAGWSSRACRAAYRYEDKVSAVAPSFGTRLILRKGIIPITISPVDVEVCGNVQISSNSCTYSLSRPLVGENDTVSVTYSVDNTNNTISITNASITYTGSEIYSYDVSIGPNAKINRKDPVTYTPKIVPVYEGVLTNVTTTTPPAQSDFNYQFSGIAPGDSIAYITSSIVLDNSNEFYNVQVTNYALLTSSIDCIVYTGSILPVTQVPIVTPKINIVVKPKNIEEMCGYSTVLNPTYCDYDIVEGYIVDPENDIISVEYYVHNESNADGSYYYISSVSITKGGSGNYEYNITTEGTASVTKRNRETVNLTITPTVEQRYPTWGPNSADSPGTLAEKFIITANYSGLLPGDSVGSFDWVITNDGTEVTIQAPPTNLPVYKQSDYNNGCYQYSITRNIFTYTFDNPDIYPVSFTPIINDPVCTNYTVTTDDVSYIYNGIIKNGDIPNLTYSVDNSNDTISIINAEITKANPSDDSYSYSITTNSGIIERKIVTQLTIELNPVCNDIILCTDSMETVLDKINYQLSGDYNSNDTVTNVTYSGSKDDTTGIITVSISNYTINYEEGSCRNYGIAMSNLVIYPVDVTGQLNVCVNATTEDIENSFGSIDPQIAGLLNEDSISNINYSYDSTTGKITPDVSGINISKTGNDNYWYSFCPEAFDVNKTSNTQYCINISPNCSLGNNVLYSTDTDEHIINKITFDCIIDQSAVKSGDSISFTDLDKASSYDIIIDRNNNIVSINVKNNIVMNQTIASQNANKCYEYIACISQDSQTFNITQVIDVTVIADPVTFIKGSEPILTWRSNPLQLDYGDTISGVNLTYNIPAGETEGTITVDNNYTVNQGSERPLRWYNRLTQNGIIKEVEEESITLTISTTVQDICDSESLMNSEELQEEMDSANITTNYTLSSGNINELNPSITYNNGEEI